MGFKVRVWGLPGLEVDLNNKWIRQGGCLDERVCSEGRGLGQGLKFDVRFNVRISFKKFSLIIIMTVRVMMIKLVTFIVYCMWSTVQGILCTLFHLKSTFITLFLNMVNLRL